VQPQSIAARPVLKVAIGALIVLTLALAGVAYAAVRLSFTELERLDAARSGNPGNAYLFPFLLDGFGGVITLAWAALALWPDTDDERRWLAIGSYVIAGISATLNATETLTLAPARNTFSYSVTIALATLPPLAFSGCTHVIVLLLRKIGESWTGAALVASPVADYVATPVADEDTSTDTETTEQAPRKPHTTPRPWKALTDAEKLARVERKAAVLSRQEKEITNSAVADLCGCSVRTAGTYLRKLKKAATVAETVAPETLPAAA
jgi:Protein of unknown function (DUF2637)